MSYLVIQFKRLVLMVQFLTALPLPFRLKVENEDFGKGLVFAPLVGLLLGGILVGAYHVLAPFFPPQAVAAMLVILYILLTGGLHLDGLGDTFDGLFSNRSKERMLEIMRDSRLGTNAVLGIISVLLLNFTLLWGMSPLKLPLVLLLMPVAGRIGSLVSTGFSTYARSGEGLGKSFIDFCGPKEVFVGLVLHFAIFFAAGGVKGLLVGVFPPVTAFLLVKFFSRKIGGATGDILGAVCELNQTLFLIAAYIFLP